MAIDSSPLEELKDLLAKEAASAESWRNSLPALRARASATSVVLQQLAQTPISAVHEQRCAAVDVVLAAPSKGWAEDVACRLGDALPQAKVSLGQLGERLPEAPPPGLTVRCEVLLPERTHEDTRDAVLRALQKMSGLEIDYSVPIDLVVVAPSLDASPRR